MLDQDRSPEPRGADPDASSGETPASRAETDDAVSDTQPQTFDESMFEEVAALIDDSKTYAQAEIAFQKTRASLVGKSVGAAIGLVIVAIILLHIAFLALAVGLVMALEPLVTIWGAIAIVVGALLLLTGLLGYSAVGHGKRIGAMFTTPEEDEET